MQNSNPIMKPHKRIVIDLFCLRQFKQGSFNYINTDKQLVQQKLNQLYQQAQLVNGYAPFCKHFYIQNFLNLQKSLVEITKQNQHLLKTCYQARNQLQLPVLKRYFPKQKIGGQQKAKYLDIIMYDRRQCELMHEAKGLTDPNKQIEYDYGVIAIKPQQHMYSPPMEPITSMRNGLGKQHGGAGHPIDREKYIQSVKFWQNHALLR